MFRRAMHLSHDGQHFGFADRAAPALITLNVIPYV